MQPATAIEAGIDDQRLLVGILSQYFIEGDAEAGVIHAANMHITDFSSREAVHQVFHHFSPAVVQQYGALDTGLDWFDCLLILRTRGGIVEADQRELASFPVQQSGPIGSGSDRYAVDAVDHRITVHMCTIYVEGASRDHFFHPQSISFF